MFVVDGPLQRGVGAGEDGDDVLETGDEGSHVSLGEGLAGGLAAELTFEGPSFPVEVDRGLGAHTDRRSRGLVRTAHVIRAGTRDAVVSAFGEVRARIGEARLGSVPGSRQPRPLSLHRDRPPRTVDAAGPEPRPV